MRRLLPLLLITFAALGQIDEPFPSGLPQDRGPFPSPRRPSHIAMARVDFQNNQKDVVELRRLARELQTEISRDGVNVVNVNTIKDAERIEKLAKNIKDRLKRY